MHIQALVLTVSTAAVVNGSQILQNDHKMSDFDLIEHTSVLLDNYGSDFWLNFENKTVEFRLLMVYKKLS